MKICRLCKAEFPNRIKIGGKIKNLSSRKYCIDCSPFGRHNTRALEKIEDETLGKICNLCGVFKEPNEFYRRRKKKNILSPYCRQCSNIRAISRQRALKKRCVDYLGGLCQKCGYCNCIGALEFHHKDPTQKDFTIGRIKSYKWSKTIKDELDKCKLLCANCHREEHYLIR